MAHSHANPPAFDDQYRPLSKAVFDERARDEVARGSDPVERARAYAARGKPEFVLAFLLVSVVADAEKRTIYAAAHDQRAENTERKAHEMDQQFHRPFPLLASDAARDRAVARQIRAGQPIQRGAGKHLPMA
jgi:hypothetical protein